MYVHGSDVRTLVLWRSIILYGRQLNMQPEFSTKFVRNYFIFIGPSHQ